MGDCFQSLVAPDVPADRAEAEAKRMLAWLIGEGIVSDVKEDCILNSELGYPPGRNLSKAIEETAHDFLSLRINGLHVITKRTVFHSGQGGCELICSSCESWIEPADGWGNAISEWFDRRGPGLLECPMCGASRPVIEWQHEPAWGFGELGFQFWNWPRIAKEFVGAFQKELDSRVVYVYGKL